MKKWPKIKMLIEDVYQDNKHSDMERDKFNSQDWSKWLELTKGIEFGDIKLLNDSTGQNKCYTNLAVCESYKDKRVAISNTFYIQKSILGDFVTFFGLNRTMLFYEGHKVVHPELMIVSPLGPFVDLFRDSWSLVEKEYPNIEYVPYSLLKERIEDVSIYSLLFGYGGKLSSNVFGDIHFGFNNF